MKAGSIRPVLDASFFDDPADAVARNLLGKILIRRNSAGQCHRFMVTETEAYLGPQDLACHAARGRTARTEVMFGPAGALYIYLVYGLHWMLNVVTGPSGHPAAVLIRSAGHVEGPGRLGNALMIDRALNGKPASPRTGLWFEAPAAPPGGHITATPRIGVAYAGPHWSRRKLRFVLTVAPEKRTADRAVWLPIGCGS